MPKTEKVERLGENLNIFDFQLNAQEMTAISGLNKNERYLDTAVFTEAAFGHFCPIYWEAPIVKKEEALKVEAPKEEKAIPDQVPIVTPNLEGAKVKASSWKYAAWGVVGAAAIGVAAFVISKRQN